MVPGWGKGRRPRSIALMVTRLTPALSASSPYSNHLYSLKSQTLRPSIFCPLCFLFALGVLYGRVFVL
jgi:hypothetical protein